MKPLNLDEFNPKKAELITLSAKYKWLIIQWFDDKEWFKAVSEARKDLKATRVQLEKAWKELRAEATAFSKAVIEKQRELVWIIEPLEIELKKQEDEVLQEKERIKQEELKKAEELLQKRIDAMMRLWREVNILELKILTDEAFDTLYQEAKKEYEEQEEKNRQEKAEQDKIAKEQEEQRKEIEKQQADIKAAQDKIDSDNKVLQDEKDKVQREKDLETARKEWEEKAKMEAEETAKLNQERKEAEEKEKALEDERIEKENQVRLEKETKYKNFIKKNEWKYDKIVKEEWKVVLIKIIDEFKI